jgi:hypothetical protein
MVVSIPIGARLSPHEPVETGSRCRHPGDIAIRTSTGTEYTMKLFALAAFAALGFYTSQVAANTLPAARYAEMMKIEMMDTNKDGAVSREEFLAAAAKMYDMAAEHMKAKDGKMTSLQLREFRSALATPR